MSQTQPSKTVATLVRAFSSEAITPEDALNLVRWSPKNWDSNTKGDISDTTVLSSLANQIGRRHFTSKWMGALLKIAEERGKPSPEVWGDVLCILYEKAGDVRKRDAIEEVRKWQALGDSRYWSTEGVRVIQEAFTHKHWGEVDAILAAGVSPDVKIDAGRKNYGEKSKAPLLAACPCLEAATICIQRGANPLVDVKGRALLEWVESREEQCFEGGNERRETVKAIRLATQKALETASPELLEQHQRNQLWSTLKTAKSWMDIQNSIQSMASSVKKFRGSNGEPFLFALAEKRPEFIPNLMRMKAASEDWWTMKDNEGATLLHYLARSYGTSTFGYRKEVDDKVRKLIDECAPQPPKSSQEWADWHATLWNWQIKNASQISTEPDKNGSGGYRDDLGGNEVKWFQTPWDVEHADPTFGKLDQTPLKHFRLDVSTPEKLNEYAQVWLQLAFETGGLPPAFDPEQGGWKNANKEIKDIDFRKLGSVQKNKFSKEAAQLGLLVSVKHVLSLQAKGHWSFGGGQKSQQILLKEALESAKDWLRKGASWTELANDVDSGKTRLHRQWKAFLDVNEDARAAWHNEWSSQLQREELSQKVFSKPKKPSAHEQFGLAL